MQPPSFTTTAVHQRRPARAYGPGLCAPLDRSTAFEGTGGPGYARLANPTAEAVAAAIASLERMESGLLFSSGTAAATAVVLALVPLGGTLVAARELCADSVQLLQHEAPRLGRRVELVDVDDLESWRRALARGASAAFVESLSNPGLRVADLPAIAGLARAAGAVSVVDSTLATPWNVRPAEHGCDLVIHSASKYLNGHSDVIAGAVAGAETLVGEVRRVQWTTGACLDPGAAALLGRGLRTLPLRMRAHNRNGLQVARHLEAHPAVDRVLHPLLDSHPDAALGQRLLGGSGVVLVRLRGGAPHARAMLDELKLIRQVPTLGGLETLAFLPADADMDGAIRLSVGVEDANDILADLDRALAVAQDPAENAPVGAGGPW